MSCVRRSGNYMPSLWDDEYLQSITSVFQGQGYSERAKELKEEIEMILADKISRDSVLGRMEFVDVLQRLGISYHFKDSIHTVMEGLFSVEDGWVSTDLHQVSLKFRLLRQHGYLVQQDVFNTFLDKKGDFKNYLSNDSKGLLSLYDASYLSMEGEEILDKAQDFAKRHLEHNLKEQQYSLDQNLGAEIRRSMEQLPLHWRVQRLEARWFISMYGKRADMNPLVLEFAILDFNLVQVCYQQELKEASRWYANTKLAERLSFARDRLVESFIWSIGSTFDPRLRYCRIMVAKLVVLATLIDDIYDVYGTLDELQLFTLAVDMYWDINALDKLPDYMKICFLALFNFVHEHAYDILKIQGFNIVPCLKQMNGLSFIRWANLCKTHMVEARWISSGHTPTLDEFLENGVVSIAVPLVCVYSYICIENPMEEKTLKDLLKLPDLVRCVSMVVRLADDLGTSSDEMKKGDVAKSIQCYMQETGCSEEEAHGHVKYLIGETMKKLNGEILSNCVYSEDYVKMCMNSTRIAQGHGIHGRI